MALFAWRRQPLTAAGSGEASPQRARRFCVATFADPAAKGAARGGRGAFAGGKNASAACGGVFAWQRSQGRAAKGAVRGGRALSGRKNTSAAARGRFCAAMFAGPDGKGRCPRRSGRSPSRKNVPHSARERLSRLVWPYGGAKRPAALRSHLRRGACSAPSAAISSPAPTRGAEGFSASRASMHRPPKTQTANRRKTNQRWM